MFQLLLKESLGVFLLPAQDVAVDDAELHRGLFDLEVLQDEVGAGRLQEVRLHLLHVDAVDLVYTVDLIELIFENLVSSDLPDHRGEILRSLEVHRIHKQLLLDLLVGLEKERRILIVPPAQDLLHIVVHPHVDDLLDVQS